MAPPISDRTHEVAVAFDYLLRFYVEHINQGKKIEKREWHALNAFHLQFHEYFLCLDDVEFLCEYGYKEKEFYKGLECRYKELMPIYDKYVKQGKITDDLLYFCLLLAKFELGYHISKKDMVKSYIEPKKNCIEDLKNIFSFVERDYFLCDKKCYLNPALVIDDDLYRTFSMFDANADLIIDDTLIEIKTVKKITRTSFKQHLNQLLGYYLLSLIGQINGKIKRSPIKYFGIYYARHGIYWREPIACTILTASFYKELDPFGNKELKNYNEFKSVKNIHKDPMVIELKEWFMKYLLINQ